MIAIPVEFRGEMEKISFYLVWMIKSKTGAFLASCKWAHDKFTWRDVKYVINGLSGGAGTSDDVDDGCCVLWDLTYIQHEKWKKRETDKKR